MTVATIDDVSSSGRFLSVLPPALTVTAGLFLLMSVLVAENFQPEDVLELGDMMINPKVEEILVIERAITSVEMKKIETPPAPPLIDIAETEMPSEPIMDVFGAKPTFNKAKIEPQTITISVADRDPEPIVRLAPAMPVRADRSGHCLVGFNVSAEGRPYDVAVTSCSQTLFARASVRAVQSWTYRPEISNGVAVERKGLQTRISFQLFDENGTIIPE